jgi:hypothetical protein
MVSSQDPPQPTITSFISAANTVWIARKKTKTMTATNILDPFMSDLLSVYG